MSISWVTSTICNVMTKCIAKHSVNQLFFIFVLFNQHEKYRQVIVQIEEKIHSDEVIANDVRVGI